MYAAPSSGKPAAAVLVILFLSGAIHHARAQLELDDERGFSYLPEAANGPSQWGVVRSEWAACSLGRLQSPIVLSAAAPALDHGRAGRLGHSYRSAAASIVNRGHDITVRFYSDPGGVVIDGVAYRLRQMHWHAPSEHAIDGKGYNLELQMVHQSEANRSVVISQLYRTSRRRRNGTIRRLERYIRRISRRSDHEELIDEPVNPRRPVSGGSVYYRYEGSFTTPPCTEGVTWLVSNRVRSVTRRQVRLLRNAVHDGARSNARPLQESNGRNISFYYTSPAQDRGTTIGLGPQPARDRRRILSPSSAPRPS